MTCDIIIQSYDVYVFNQHPIQLHLSFIRLAFVFIIHKNVSLHIHDTFCLSTRNHIQPSRVMTNDLRQIKLLFPFPSACMIITLIRKKILRNKKNKFFQRWGELKKMTFPYKYRCQCQDIQHTWTIYLYQHSLSAFNKVIALSRLGNSYTCVFYDCHKSVW